MANSREPYVEGHRVDTSVSTTVSDSKVSVYVGIEADTGTYDLTYQQTPKVFVQEYSTKSKPDTNDASTLLHAGKLVENFGIYVKRVNKDSILPGIVSTNKYGEVGYFDNNYNLIKKLTELKIEPAIGKVTDQKLAMVVDNVLYVNDNITTTAELNAEFDTYSSMADSPFYYANVGGVPTPTKMTTASGFSDAMLGPGKKGKIFEVTNDSEVLFYVINLGDVYNIEEFLTKVSKYAKDYRSDNDKSEYLSYEPDSLMMAIDISGWGDEASDQVIVQACKTLANTSRLAKALTKLEFTEGSADESLLTGTKYYETTNVDEIKYLDIGGYRYYPQISGDNRNYNDSIVTCKPSKFAKMSTDFAMNGDAQAKVAACSVSDGLLSSIDTMLTEDDTVKPDSVYCSTEQIFRLNIAENQSGAALVPSVDIKYSNGYTTETKTVTSGLFGEGFESSLIRLYIRDIEGNWAPFDGSSLSAAGYIDAQGYAYLKFKFDGEVEDISDLTAGVRICYTIEVQDGNDVSETSHVLVFGKNVAITDVLPDGVQTATEGDTVDVVNISAKTTDLGVICSLPYFTFGPSLQYKFGKVNATYNTTADPDTLFLVDSSNALSNNDDSNLAANNGQNDGQEIEASRIHKLYLYFLNNRNVTFGITGYNEKCWKKYTTVLQRNYVFKSQDSVSLGLPGYHAIQIKDTLYYNGTLGSESGPTLDSRFDYDNEVPISTIALTARDFITELDQALRNNFKLIAKLSSGDYVFGEELDKSKIIYTDGLAVKDFMPINQEENFVNARYAIVQKFTSAAKLFSIDLTFDKTDNEILKFVNSYNGREYTDKISFNVSKIDGYGTNISYKSYNLFDGRTFFIKELNEEAPVIEMSVSSFGDDIKPKKATSTDYVNALDDLITDEFKPSYIWDAGLCQSDYINAMSSMADKTYSTIPISTPKDAESFDDVRSWKLSFMTDNVEQYFLDGWHYNTVFGDISFECCPTYYYLVNVLANANSITKEFQPMFYKTRGVVSAGVPVRNIPLTKDEREKLLDLRVNSIVRNKANSISYINQNFTNQQVESDFSEEQNVRISNEVCRSADNYADNNIIAKNNTPNLRATITSELTRILRERILDSRGDDTAKSFYVECNDVNNPESIVKARKVVIDVYVTYNKSANAVLIYSRTKSLDQG